MSHRLSGVPEIGAVVLAEVFPHPGGSQGGIPRVNGVGDALMVLDAVEVDLQGQRVQHPHTAELAGKMAHRPKRSHQTAVDFPDILYICPQRPSNIRLQNHVSDGYDNPDSDVDTPEQRRSAAIPDRLQWIHR